MDVVSYCTFLHDSSFRCVYLSFKDKFYKDRLHFCTFKVGEGGSKVNGGESR